jgi:hypothetical protein
VLTPGQRRRRRRLVAELRLLTSTRRSAVKARTQGRQPDQGLPPRADDELRASIRPRFGRACAALEPADSLRRTLATLGRRWLVLDTEARELQAQITALIGAHAPRLLAATASAR